MKTICVDIGNTSVKKGISVNNKISNISHLNYSKKDLSKLITFLKKDLTKSNRTFICSVVPAQRNK